MKYEVWVIHHHDPNDKESLGTRTSYKNALKFKEFMKENKIDTDNYYLKITQKDNDN